ncbi:MAG: response regulator [Nitrospiraceae bacterium]|nr:response regulator [Nitrospiraceae bacterium]
MKTARILIVEDSPTQAEGLKHVLEHNGYNATVARNGREALAHMRSRGPDLVISDIVMPEMDGFALCKKIKTDEDLGNIPVILLTALSDAGDVLKGLECGADNFITKPYDKNYLIRRIINALSAAGTREKEQAGKAVEIIFGAQRYFIVSGRKRILELLLSTYETAVMKNRELTVAQQELKQANIVLQMEIAERERAEAALKDSLQEKEILLKELYHRTKNNMNAVSGLLSLQMTAAKDPHVRQMFKDAQGRIHSMALVHEMLYKTKELSKLDLKDYLEQLARSVVISYKASNIRLDLDLDSIPVSLYVATPCGLIVNELLSNSMEHAFPGGMGGEVNLSLKAKGSEIEMVCSDSGAGFPEGFQIGRSSSLGLKLVDELAGKQLMGGLEISGRQKAGPGGKGARAVIRFDISRLEERDRP